MSRETEPLTPEERALAQRLARLSAQAEPSPSLDARILAAAHAAAAPRAARKRRPRWPALLGYAATAAIACGIAWQLRPLPNRPMATSAADASTYEEPLAEVAAPPPPPMQARPIPPRPLNMPEPPPAEPPPARPQRRSDIRSASAADAAEKPRAFEPVFEVDEAVPAHPGADVAGASANAAAAAPAPPPPAAAPPAFARQREEAAAAKAQANEAAARARDASTLDSVTVLEPQSAEADEEVVPPATADSPAVREAWFKRIRELLRAGKTDEARASLREFRHRYPRQPLPDDLRALDVE